MQQRGYRYYNPQSGRWQSRDPLGENGFELLRSVASGNTLTGKLVQRLVSFVERHGYSPAEMQEVLKWSESSEGITAVMNPYEFVRNAPLSAIDPLGDAWAWLEKLSEMFETASSYICPSPIGEVVGGVACVPDAVALLEVKKLRNDLLAAIAAGDAAKIAEANAKLTELVDKLADNGETCRKKKCCKPKP